jgi:membrane protein
MNSDFQDNLKEAGRLASQTIYVIKVEWSKERRFVGVVLRHLQRFWVALEKIFPTLGRLRHFCWGVLIKYHHDDCFSYAAGLSFWLLISLLPMATLFFKLLEIFLGNQAFVRQTQNILMNAIPFLPESFLNDAVIHTREVGNSMGLAWFVLLFGSYWGVSQFDKSLAHVFGVRINKQLQTRKNHIVRQMGLLVGGLVVLAISLALLVGGGVLKHFSPTYQHIFVNNLTIIVILAMTTLLLQYLPRLHIAFRHAFLGALVSTFFWAAARWGFKIYIDHALTWDIMYGSLLSIIAGLTFLYYTCAILLLGAEVTAAFYCTEERVD